MAPRNARPVCEPLERRTLLSVAFEIADFFPEQNQQIWEYQGDHQGVSATVKTINTSAFFNATDNVSASNAYRYDGAVREVDNRFWSVDDEGLKLHGIVAIGANFTRATVFDDPALLVAADATSGDGRTFAGGLTGRQVGTNESWTGAFSGSATIGSFETIATPAGTFDAARLDWSLQYDLTRPDGADASGRRAETWWLARDYGLVKFERDDSRVGFDGAAHSIVSSMTLTSTNFTPAAPWYAQADGVVSVRGQQNPDGSPRNDQFSLDARNGFVSFSLNGKTAAVPADQIDSISFDGLGGADRLTVFASDGADALTLRADGATTLDSPGLSFSAQNIGTTYAFGDAADTVTFFDSSGNDHFRSLPEFSDLRGAGFDLHAKGFGVVRAIASAGGDDDYAALTDTHGDDRLISFADRTTLTGGGLDRRVEGFERIDTFATRGGADDFAELYDTAHDDNLKSLGAWSRLRHDAGPGPGHNRFVSGFDRVNSYAIYGGSDFAEFSDTAADDTFRSFVGFSDTHAAGGGPYRYASGFEKVNAYGDRHENDHDRIDFQDSGESDVLTSTGDFTQIVGAGVTRFSRGYDLVIARSQLGGSNDVAHLHDTPADETLQSTADATELTGAGLRRRLEGFATVNVYADHGGRDVAHVYDAAGDDLFKLYESKFDASDSAGGYRFFRAFEQAHLHAENGGDDEAVLFDSTGDDHASGTGDEARITGVGFDYRLKGFGSLTLNGLNGGTNTSDFADVSYTLHEVGPWT